MFDWRVLNCVIFRFRRVLILLGLEVLNNGIEVGEKVGDPVPLSEETTRAEQPSTSTNSNSTLSGPSAYKPAADSNSSNINTQLIHPISSLSPYQNKWVIKARVTTKSPIRSWNNAKGEGKLFSMDLMDVSGEIRATAFKDMCDKYYEMIQVNDTIL